VLVYRGVSRVQAYWRGTWASRAWVVTTAYAALDETHQMLVASRTGSIYDVLIDCIGVSAALLALRLWHHYVGATSGTFEQR
jgi:VanZ family protein